MLTKYFIGANQYIFGPQGDSNSRTFYIREDNVIIGPLGHPFSCKFWINENGWIFGPNGKTDFYVSENRIFGPSDNLPFF